MIARVRRPGAWTEEGAAALRAASATFAGLMPGLVEVAEKGAGGSLLLATVFGALFASYGWLGADALARRPGAPRP